MNISVKKFSKKSLSLLIALIMVFSALPFTPPISADAATQDVSKSVKVSDYGVISNGGRIGRGYFEIVNDGKNSNFSIGVLKFDLSNINKSTDVIKSAQYTLQHACIPSNNNRTNGMQLGFYYPTKNNNTYTLNNDWTATNTGDAKNNIITSETNSKFSHFGTAVNYFGLKEIKRVTSKADSVTYSLTLELADMMNYFLQQGETKATLMILLIGNDATISETDGPWSDRKVTPSMSDFSVTCMQTTAYSGTTEIDMTAYNNAISAFMSKMNDSNVLYYNMEAAYNAYIALKQSYDLFYYGGSTTITADTVNNNIDKLFKAVNNMKVWSSYNSFFDPNEPSQLFAGDYASGIYGTAYKNYYKNTLYVAGSVNDINSSKTDYMTVMWNMPYAVGLYTGSAIEVPVMTGIKADTGSSWGKPNGYMYTNYLVNNYSNQINYKDNWYYRSGIGSKHFSYSTIQPTGIAVSKTKQNTSGYNYYCGYGNDPRWAYNAITINPTEFSNNYQEFTSLDLYCRASRTSGLATSETSGNLISVTGAPIGYYVIDYRPVPNYLTTAKTKIKSGIANFDSDNLDMSSLMSSVDKLTNLNNTIASTFPSTASGVSQATCRSNAKTIANNITSYVSEFTTNNNNTTSDASKTTAYNILRSAMDSTMADYKKGADELKKTYTASSVDAFITAYNNAKSIMSKVGSFDDNYGHDASDTNTKASELTAAYANLVKNVTVTFYDVLKAELKTLKVTPGTTIYESDLPALTQPTYSQNNKHNIYYWAYSDGTAFTVPFTVNADIDVEERLRTESCSFKVKSIDGNTSTVSCSVCNGGTYTLDIKAYKDIVSVAQEAINDKAKYDSDSRANLQKVLNNNTVNDCITIKQVDAKISAIQTAINALVLNKYSITVKYVDEHGTDLGVGENGATSKTYPAVDYGSILNVVAPTNYNKVDYAVYKWTREDKSNSSISGLNSSSLDVVVKGASTYYVFLKNTSVDDTKVGKNAVITLNNKSGNIVDIGYVPMNQNGTETTATVTVDTNAGTIKIGDATLTAPKYSFYNLIGFEIGGIRVASGQTITLNSKMVIKPVYEAKQTVKITRASANILINGKDDDSVDVEWNKKIVMTYNGEVPDGKVVIWKDGNGNVLAQGPTYSFYANSNVTISATVEASAPKDPTASIGLFSYDPTDNKVTVVNNFYVPEGKKAVKAGVILSTKSTLADMSNEERVNFLKDQTTGRFYGTEDKFSGTDTNKNQIRISVTRTANTSFTMYALAYVVVIENGKEKPYYAPTVQSITYTGTNS